MSETKLEDLKPMLREIMRRARRRSPTRVEAMRKRHEEFVRELETMYLHSLAEQRRARPTVSCPQIVPLPPDGEA